VCPRPTFHAISPLLSPLDKLDIGDKYEISVVQLRIKNTIADFRTGGIKIRYIAVFRVSLIQNGF